MMSKEEVEAAIAALESTVSTLDTWVLIFTAMVAIGVAGELYTGVAHWLKDKQLRPLRTSQAQYHEKEVADLNARTKEAELELERIRSRRHISVWDQAAITTELRKFAGTSFDATVKQGDTSGRADELLRPSACGYPWWPGAQAPAKGRIDWRGPHRPSRRNSTCNTGVVHRSA